MVRINLDGADSLSEKDKLTVYKVIKCSMIAMLLTVIVMAFVFHVYDRTAAIVNTFAMLSIMLIISLLCLAYGKCGENILNMADFLLMQMLFVVYALTFMSAVMAILDGGRRFIPLMCALRALTSILSAFLLMMFSWFDQTFIVLPPKQDRGLKKAGIISLGLYTLVILIGIRTGWFFRVSADAMLSYGRGYAAIMLYYIGWSLVYGYLIISRLGFNNVGRTLIVYRGVYIAGMFIFAALVIIKVEITLSWIFILFPFVSLMVIFCYKYSDIIDIILRQQKIIANRERDLMESQLNTMLLRISPHFISNTLGSVDSLMEEDPAEAREMLRRFSKLLRSNYVDITEESMIPFSKEMDNLKTYLEIQQMRFPNIKTEFDIKADDFNIPNLTLQPLCENAIKHGIRKRPKSAGTITIESYKEEDVFIVKITDDGVGFKEPLQDDRAHVGVNNVRQRLELMTGGSLEIESEPAKGTICTITIPEERQI